LILLFNPKNQPKTTLHFPFTYHPSSLDRFYALAFAAFCSESVFLLLTCSTVHLFSASAASGNNSKVKLPRF
jgi:hypothetical protein